MHSFSYVDGSLSLNCVNGNEAYSSSAVRAMVILVEDGEGVRSFRFFSALILSFGGVDPGYPQISVAYNPGYHRCDIPVHIPRISADILGPMPQI